MITIMFNGRLAADAIVTKGFVTFKVLHTNYFYCYNVVEVKCPEKKRKELLNKFKAGTEVIVSGELVIKDSTAKLFCRTTPDRIEILKSNVDF